MLELKMVLKDENIVLNCLVGCINIFLIFDLLYQKVTKFCAFCRTVGDLKSHYIGQFQILYTPEPTSNVTCSGTAPIIVSSVPTSLPEIYLSTPKLNLKLFSLRSRVLLLKSESSVSCFLI